MLCGIFRDGNMAATASVAVEGGPVYSSSSPRRCWRPHVTHTCIRPNLTFYSRVRGCTRGRDSKTPRAITIPISTPLAVRQSQLSRTGHSMTMASVLSRQRVVLRSTRWEGPCIMDTGPIPAGWIRAVSWSTETPDHISLRPPCSSDHPRSTSSYLVAFRANPSGSRGASGLPPLHMSLARACFRQ